MRGMEVKQKPRCIRIAAGGGFMCGKGGLWNWLVFQEAHGTVL